MKPAIKVENLSKLYHLGSEQKNGHRTLRDALGNMIAAPWRRVRQLHRTPPAPNTNGAYTPVTGTPDKGIIWAVKDLSFEVRPGEMLGVIGRNGSGKSTLLRILSGITEPTSGRVSIYGRIGSLLEVGTGIHPDLSGRENIYLSGAIAGLSRRDIARQFDAIVAFAELEKFIDTPVKHYSSGMQMRLGFAVACHLEAHVMLVDEALAVGDVAFQAKCYAHLDRLHKSGMTIILISHTTDEIEMLCDHAIWLDKGAARARGRCTDVIHDYLKAMGQGEPEMPADTDWVTNDEARAQLKAELKEEIQAELKEEIRVELKEEIQAELKEEIQREIRDEIQADLKPEIRAELKEEIGMELRDEIQAGIHDAAHEENKDQLQPEILSPALAETPHQSKRRGTQEIEILGLRILNAQGQEQRCFATGDAMIVDMTYLAHQRIERPVFGIVFSSERLDSPNQSPPYTGVSNTQWANQVIDAVEPGRGTVRCRIPCLPFYKGFHFIDVTVHSESEDVYYDYQEKIYNFHITPTRALDSQGYLYLPAQWEYPDIDRIDGFPHTEQTHSSS